MKKSIKDRMKGRKDVAYEAIRFAMVGVFATLLHYGLYYVLLQWLDANISYAIGYILAFFCNFFLTAIFTFRSPPSWRKLIGMSGAHGVNFLLHMALLNLFLCMGISARLAPIPVFAIAIPVNFVLVKWVFKSKKTK